MTLPDALLVRSSAGLYGADHAVLSLVAALPRLGSGGRLLAIENYRMHEQPLYERARSFGMDAILLRCRRRFDPVTVRCLREQLRSAPDAVLHANDYKSAFYAWLASRGRRTKLVATLHGWIETSRALRLYKRLEMALLRSFDALVIVADAQRATLLGAGIKAERIVSIPNGIDVDRFSPSASAISRSEFGIADGTYLFGTVARLSPEKNLGAFVDALASLRRNGRDAAMLVVGDGPERSDLEARAAAAGIGAHVHFTGARNDVERIYPVLDCFVLPSLTEGMPLSVLEAMASERPVIASAVGEIPTLLRGTDRGRLVQPGNTDDLAAAMEATLAAGRAPDVAARRRVETDYSVLMMARRYADLYRGLQGRRP